MNDKPVFIDRSAPPGGDGSQQRPFDSIERAYNGPIGIIQTEYGRQLTNPGWAYYDSMPPIKYEIPLRAHWWRRLGCRLGRHAWWVAGLMEDGVVPTERFCIACGKRQKLTA